MRALTRICGRSITIVHLMTSSPFKAKSDRRSPISCTLSSPRRKKQPSRNDPRATWWPTIFTCGGAKSFGSQIKIVGHQVARGSFLDGCFFRRGELSVQLIGDRLCDFALNGEDVIKWTIVMLRPQMRVSARIDQLRAHAHSTARPLHASF